MTRASSSAAAVLAMMLFLPAAVHAQAQPFSIRAFGDAGLTVFSATQSFKAILGRPSGTVFGGGLEVGLPKQLFVSVAASRFRRTGHRVFVFEGQVFELDDPATITVTPLEVSAGYRFTQARVIVPYAGGGIGWHKYEETSAHSTDADDVHTTFRGYQVLGGAEVPLGGWLAVAAEGQFASVPNALGANSTGVASVYNEHNLGGFTVRVKVVVGR